MPTLFLNIALSTGGQTTMPALNPKKAFRGRDRHRIVQLKNYLTQIQTMDVRRVAQATAAGAVAVRFNQSGETSFAGQIAALLARCDTALSQRVALQAAAPPP